MSKKILLTLCLLPGLAWGQNCEFETFKEITNTFYDRVHNNFGTPGESHSTDFDRYEPYWVETQSLVGEQMPDNLADVYRDYRATYERLDKVYALNQSDTTVREEHECQQKFYIEEVLNAFLPGTVASIAPNCDRDMSLSEEDRTALKQELNASNLRTCKFEAGEAEDPATFAPPTERENPIEFFTSAVSSFDWPWFDLTPDQQSRINDEVVTTEDDVIDPETEETTDSWWEGLQKLFSFGESKETNDSDDALGRFSNFSATEEIDDATRMRRARFENRRNFWIERSIKSAKLQDMHDFRFEEEILADLTEGNTSIEASLEAIGIICRDQRTEVSCWDGKNTVPNGKLWSPYHDFSPEAASPSQSPGLGA